MAKKDRVHRVVSTLPDLDSDDRLLLDDLSYQDALGRPYKCVVRAVSLDSTIQELDLLGTSITIRFEPEKGQQRFINGLVCAVSYDGIEDKFSRYQIEIRPWLWFLKHTANSRIFQDMSVIDIVKKVFKQTHNFSDFKVSVSGTYKPRVYCVQYQESDFDFVSRLMEEEGIYYYVEHEETKHTIVLIDDAAKHRPIAPNSKLPFRLPGNAPVDLKHVHSWTFSSQLRTTSVALNDYDFEKPSANLSSKSQVRREHKLAKFERFDFPGRYTEAKAGEQFARLRVEELQSDFQQFYGIGNALGLSTGHYFQLKEHPRDDQNKVDYLITDASLQIVSAETQIFSGRSNEFDVQFTAIKKSQQFRPARITPRPVVTGPQSAVVVGKSGEEIWTDKYGRVKIQFPWDREGKKDENSSCWVRVSNSWAGKGWGTVHIPRIGQEVLVDFIDGDLDRPIITGRVYNANETTPYSLPGNQTQSGIKTHSTKKGKQDNFNELRFEDKLGEEEIYFHAEKDFTQIVENDATLKIGLDKKDKGDQTIEVHNNRSLTVNEGDETIEIKKGNRTLTVGQGDETIEISQGNRSLTVSMGNETIEVKLGNRTIDVKAGKQTTTAALAIEFKVGGSTLKIEPAKISIQSPVIEIKGQGKAEVSAPITDVKGAGMLTLGGGVVKIN